MKKFFRILLSLIIGVIIISLVAIAGIAYFINPNEFKPEITKHIQDYTGRRVELNGNIGWSFFPWLGVEVNQVQIDNAAGFGDEPFALIKSADVKIKFMPLLSGHIQVANLTLNGMDLHLMKNSNGVTNWQDIVDRFSHKKIKNPSKNSAVTKTAQALTFAIGDVTILNSNIFWNDQQKNKTLAITNLRLQSRNIRFGEKFPIELQFSLNSNAPKVNGNFLLTTQALIDLVNKSYLLDQLRFQGKVNTASLPDNQLSFDSKGTLTINPQEQTLNFSDVKMNLANNNLLGAVKVSNLLTEPLIQGSVKTDTLQWNKLQASHVSLAFNIHNNKINLAPITAQLYQGNYTGSILIDTTNAEPKIVTQTQLSGIQAEPLFAALSDITYIKLTGTANLTADLAMQGTDKNSLLHSLNGEGKFTLSNGVLKGIDLSYWIRVGKSLIKKDTIPVPSSDSYQTPFGNTTGTFNIANGVLQNHDLVIHASRLAAQGKGTVDLANQRLDYLFTIQSMSESNQPEGTPLPLKVEGPFSNISIRPDVGSIVKTQLKNKVQEKVGKILENHLGKDAAKEIQKNLNNLFH
jgi:AsmA protein